MPVYPRKPQKPANSETQRSRFAKELGLPLTASWMDILNTKLGRENLYLAKTGGAI